MFDAEIRQRAPAAGAASVHPGAAPSGSHVDGALRGVPSSSSSGSSSSSRASGGPTSESDEVHGDAQFLHGSVLLTACAPSVGIILAFGGRPALLVLCFGALVAYIFDILGSVEGTLITILVTGLGMWSTVVWSARMILSESTLNFSLVIVMGALLCEVFVVVCASFRSLLNEFDSLFYFLEVVLFATVPLLNTVIVTWFLCVEVPSLDFPLCFSTVYFAYVTWLARPRRASHPAAAGNARVGPVGEPVLTLPRKVLMLMYALPVVLSFVLHAAVHHNVLMERSWTRAAGLLISALSPLMYMATCAESQLEYWPAKARQAVALAMGRVKLVGSTVVFLCMQSHPTMRDLKAFSGLHEPASTAAICGAAVLAAMAVHTHRMNTVRMFNDLPEDEVAYRTAKVTDFRVSVFLAGSAYLVGNLMGMPASSLTISVTGAFAAADFYRRPVFYTWSTLPRILASLMPLATMMLSVIVVLINFAQRTVLFMTYEFTWAPLPMTMQAFCGRFFLLSSISAVTPTLCMGLNDHLAEQQQQQLQQQAAAGFDLDVDQLPGAARSSKGPTLTAFFNSSGNAVDDLNPHSWGIGKFLREYVKPNLFAGTLLACATAVCAGELVAREQDWSTVHVTGDVVYPSYLFVASGFFSVVAGVHLYSIDKVGPATVWVLLVVQACKLLTLLGVSSYGIAASVALVLSYSAPFAVHFRDPRSSPSEGSGSSKTGGSSELLWHPKLSAGATAGYLVLSTLATIWARGHVVHDALLALLARQPSYARIDSACVGVWCAFAALLITVFFPSLPALRSVLLLAAMGAALVASEAFGPLSVSIDPDSPTFIVIDAHPELAADHGGFFMLLSIFMLAAAAGGLLPVRKAASRFLFIVAFSYCAANALLEWAFPLALNKDSPHDGTFQLPWVYCLATVFFATSAAIHSGQASGTKAAVRDASASSSASKEALHTGTIMFVVSGSLPFAGIVWAGAMDTVHANLSGVLWVAALANAMIAICTRAAELSREISGVKGGWSRSVLSASLSASSATVCLLSAVAGIVWTASASLVTPHVSSDLTVPLACLLLLCTRRNLLVSDVHPLALAAYAASSWWYLSTTYAIFGRGFAARAGIHDFELNVGIFGKEDVSFWTHDGVLIPLLNLVLAAVPAPAIVLGFLRRKGDSEDMMFVMAVLSAVSVIGAGCSSVRLLGVMGVVFGFWRVYDIGQKHVQSNRLI